MQNSTSCIDLVFTSQPNSVIELGVHSSIHSSCHYQIVFVETDLSRGALNDFVWQRAFSNTNVNEKVCIFNKSVLNVLINFIPYETILCDDKDPPWFNSQIISFSQAKNKVFKSYRKSKTNIQLLNKLNILQERVNGFITKSKNNHYEHMANKLKNLQINSKWYWSFLKCFLNNIKIPLIPPLFHKNKFVTNFLEKAEFFNSFFFHNSAP